MQSVLYIHTDLSKLGGQLIDLRSKLVFGECALVGGKGKAKSQGVCAVLRSVDILCVNLLTKLGGVCRDTANLCKINSGNIRSEGNVDVDRGELRGLLILERAALYLCEFLGEDLEERNSTLLINIVENGRIRNGNIAYYLSVYNDVEGIYGMLEIKVILSVGKYRLSVENISYKLGYSISRGKEQLFFATCL